MIIRGYILGLAIVICAACNAGKRTGSGSTSSTNNNTNNRRIACPEMELPTALPHIDWMPEKREVLRDVTTMPIPKAYEVYAVDSQQLKDLFRSVSVRGADTPAIRTIIPLPPPAGCQVFELRESATMSEELKAKYPGIISLQGAAVGARQNDIRLDGFGIFMRGQITWNGEIYFITPVNDPNGGLHYIVYAKKDSAEPKQPFENPPVIQQQRYDR